MTFSQTQTFSETQVEAILPKLEQTLADNHEDVRIMAARAIRNLGDKASRSSLPLALNFSRRYPKATDEYSIVLQRLGKKARPAVPILLKYLNDPKIQVPAARALQEIGGYPEEKKFLIKGIVADNAKPDDEWDPSAGFK